MFLVYYFILFLRVFSACRCGIEGAGLSGSRILQELMIKERIIMKDSCEGSGTQRRCVASGTGEILWRRAVKFVKDWSLPLGICTGAAVYAAFHFISFLNPLKPAALAVSEHLIPVLLFVMLFFTFCRISPRDMKIRPWHLWLCAFQVMACAAIAVALHFSHDPSCKELAEGAMVCFVCPTATAAAVITGKLGGNESSLTTYTIISNIVAAVAIPALFPLVEGHPQAGFIGQAAVILGKVFPLLICPLVAAMAVRYLLPKLHDAIIRHCGSVAFYLWAFSLVMVIGQALRSVVNSHLPAGMLWLLAATGLFACVLQFVLGKSIGGHYGDRISGGQGLGQKNTVFAIWVSVAYLSPVVSIAPSSYILWQNIINSWQLWRKRLRDASVVQPRKEV